MTTHDQLTASALDTLGLRKAASARCLYLDLMELLDALAEARAALVGLDVSIREAGSSEVRRAMAPAMASSA